MKREEPIRSSARQTDLTGEAKMNLSRSRKPSRNVAIFNALSDARQFKMSRLEFRPFCVVAHYKKDVALTDFLVAKSPLNAPLVENPNPVQILQQAIAEKAIFSASRQQHLFAITPSESISIAPSHRIEISGLPEEGVVNALIYINSVWEVQ